MEVWCASSMSTPIFHILFAKVVLSWLMASPREPHILLAKIFRPDVISVGSSSFRQLFRLQKFARNSPRLMLSDCLHICTIMHQFSAIVNKTEHSAIEFDTINKKYSQFSRPFWMIRTDVVDVLISLASVADNFGSLELLFLLMLHPFFFEVIQPNHTQ